MELIAFLLALPSGWLALIGAVFGGVGMKVLEYRLNRPNQEIATAKAFRDELRADVMRLRDELHAVEKENDELRDKYWKAIDDHASALAAIKLNAFKTNTIAEVVNDKHPEEHLPDRLKDIPD